MPARDRELRVGVVHRRAANLRVACVPGQPLDDVVAESRVVLPEELRGGLIARLPCGEQLFRLLFVLDKPRAIRQATGRRCHFFGSKRRILAFAPSVRTYSAPSGPPS